MNRLLRTISAASILICSFNTANSQEDNDWLGGYVQARREMLEGYDQFRKNILTDYDEFLEGIWTEYEKFAGKERDLTPKPDEPPVYKPEQEPEEPVVVSPTIPDIPSIPVVPTPEEPTVPKIEPPTIPAVPVVPTIPSQPTVEVDFFGERLNMPKVSGLDQSCNISATSDIASYWKQLKESNLKNSVTTLKSCGKALGMSDWGLALIAEEYVASLMPSATRNQKVIAQQFLLANSGYNVLLGMTGGYVVMLVPFAEEVYEMSYLNKEGTKYYLYPTDAPEASVMSCELPDNADLGSSMGLRFSGNARTGNASRHFELSGAGITISGSLSTGIMPLINKYPIIPIPVVACSSIDKDLRLDIVEQIANQVEGLSEQQAANQILHFVQKAFKYATDNEQFGREKYFYFEESLYYPMNDCEDRAIFFSYLIKEILHLDVHLIHYPGHECTAIAFSSPVPNSTSYMYNGKRYYISDPTYIGADIGQCMPDYQNVSPQIDL